jgi:hypothetical protein
VSIEQQPQHSSRDTHADVRRRETQRRRDAREPKVHADRLRVRHDAVPVAIRYEAEVAGVQYDSLRADRVAEWLRGVIRRIAGDAPRTDTRARQRLSQRDSLTTIYDAQQTVVGIVVRGGCRLLDAHPEVLLEQARRLAARDGIERRLRQKRIVAQSGQRTLFVRRRRRRSALPDCRLCQVIEWPPLPSSRRIVACCCGCSWRLVVDGVARRTNAYEAANELISVTDERYSNRNNQQYTDTYLVRICSEIRQTEP